MRLLFTCCAFIALLPAMAQQKIAYNKSFELHQPHERIWGFIDNGKNGAMQFVTAQKRTGKYALEISSNETKPSADLEAPFFSSTYQVILQKVKNK